MSAINFFEIIRSIDSETTVEFRGKAYNWMDENHNGMYTKARKELEDAISILVAEQRFEDLDSEARRYEKTVKTGFQMYKEAHGITKSEMFEDKLDEIKSI